MLCESHHTLLMDDVVEWKIYDSDTCVVDKFSLDQWHNIMEYISSEDELHCYLQDLKDVAACFILKERASNNAIAFCLVCLIDSRRHIVEFHGGGWAADLLSPRHYFRGVSIMMRYLNRLGFKVRTQCRKENKRAFRFIVASGFRRYRQDDKRCYFYYPSMVEKQK